MLDGLDARVTSEVDILDDALRSIADVAVVVTPSKPVNRQNEAPLAAQEKVSAPFSQECMEPLGVNSGATYKQQTTVVYRKYKTVYIERILIVQQWVIVLLWTPFVICAVG